LTDRLSVSDAALFVFPLVSGCIIAESARKLIKAGKSVDDAVAGVGDQESRRHGPLHVAAAAGEVEMCRLLIKDFQANVDATDAEGNFVGSGATRCAIVKFLEFVGCPGRAATVARSRRRQPACLAADRRSNAAPGPAVELKPIGGKRNHLKRPWAALLLGWKFHGQRFFFEIVWPKLYE
jgi:hypothetical protein